LVVVVVDVDVEAKEVHLENEICFEKKPFI
jgi:hypothetical protein